MINSYTITLMDKKGKCYLHTCQKLHVPDVHPLKQHEIALEYFKKVEKDRVLYITKS